MGYLDRILLLIARSVYQSIYLRVTYFTKKIISYAYQG